MSYFGGSSRMAGDPGFFGSFGNLLKRGAKVGLGFATGGPAGAVRAAFPRPSPRRVGIVPPRTFPIVGPGARPSPGLSGLPFGVMEAPRRRRMNVGNAKALRRAIRRTDGFVRLAKSALKNTGFKIVSKSSGKVSKAAMDKAVAAAHHRGR